MDMFVFIYVDVFKNGDVKGLLVWVLLLCGKISEVVCWLVDCENCVDLIGGVLLDDKDDSFVVVLLDL